MENKTSARAKWMSENKKAILSARLPLDGSFHNARFNRGMSCGGWGWWYRAAQIAGIDVDAMTYWSGSAPTPSTAINLGVAQFIIKNAPSDLR